MLRIFTAKLKFFWTYLVRFRGNHQAYLRYLGVRIGAGCKIGTSIGNFGTEPWLIEIGDRVSITEGVVFLTHDGSSRLFRGQYADMNAEFGNRFGPIRVQDDCFIGVNTIVLPGVTIGPNVIVGAGSVVTKDLPGDSVYAGNPARRIGTLDEYIERYRAKMIPVEAADRDALRRELTRHFWGSER